MFMLRDDYVVQSWVQVTNIGLDATADNKQMAAWAIKLTRSGQPLEGVQLQLQPGTVQATTGADGQARIELPSLPANLLVGRLGEDTAILPRASYMWDTSGWSSSDCIQRTALACL